MENLSISFATKSPEEQTALRHDLNFLDELEQLELQTDREEALLRIRQKEKDLAVEFAKKSIDSSSESKQPKMEPPTSSKTEKTATSAVGWKKGFLGQTSKSVSFNSVVDTPSSNISTTSITSVSSKAKPDIAAVAAAESITNKSRPMRDKVIERFP